MSITYFFLIHYHIRKIVSYSRETGYDRLLHWYDRVKDLLRICIFILDVPLRMRFRGSPRSLSIRNSSVAS